MGHTTRAESESNSKREFSYLDDLCPLTCFLKASLPWKMSPHSVQRKVRLSQWLSRCSLRASLLLTLVPQSPHCTPKMGISSLCSGVLVYCWMWSSYIGGERRGLFLRFFCSCMGF